MKKLLNLAIIFTVFTLMIGCKTAGEKSCSSDSAESHSVEGEKKE